MHRYTIQPIDSSIPAVHQIGQDAACALHVASRLDCREADVYEDGIYLFSLQLDKNSLLCIYQREQTKPVVAA